MSCELRLQAASFNLQALVDICTLPFALLKTFEPRLAARSSKLAAFQLAVISQQLFLTFAAEN
jgi:hypothetical protein